MSKVVALEISPQGIRAAEIAGYRTKKPKLLRVGGIELNEGVAGESTVEDGLMLSEALRELWRKSSFSTRRVGLIVSGRRFLVSKHTTALTSMDVLRRMIHLESPDSFPEGTEETLFDFYPTHEYETRAGHRTDGLIISAPSDFISELAFAVQRAKLELEYVDFAPLALTRWIMRNRSEKNYALINIREESTDIATVEHSMPRTIRVLSKGLNAKRRRFEAAPQISPEENGFRGLSESPLLRRDVLGDNGVRVLVQDINLTVRTQADEIASDLECIFMAGPRAGDAELGAVVGNQFGVPVIPLAIDSISDQDDPKTNNMPSFDNFVAMAGGMR